MRKKHKYNKNEFINIVCKNCNLCRNTGNPTFCYTVIYRNHKRRFIQKAFPKLLTLKKKLAFSGKSLYTADSDSIESIFKQVFVENNFVKHKNISKYLVAFETQLNNDIIKIFKPKKKEKKFVIKAYPTFFSNDREGLQEEIQKILL